VSEVAKHLQWHLKEQGMENADKQIVETLIPLYAERTVTLKQLAAQLSFMFMDFESYNVNAAKKHLKISAAEPLEKLQSILTALDEWGELTIQAAIEETMNSLEIGMGKIGMPLRVAITGGGQSPGLDVLCTLMGKEKTLQRITQALAYIENRKRLSENR